MHTNYFIILLPGYEDVQILLENGKLLQKQGERLEEDVERILQKTSCKHFTNTRATGE